MDSCKYVIIVCPYVCHNFRQHKVTIDPRLDLLPDGRSQAIDLGHGFQPNRPIVRVNFDHSI